MPTKQGKVYKERLLFVVALTVSLIAIILLTKIFQNYLPKTPVTSKTPAMSNSPSDPTANWKTYTNERFGIEFKYPENWKLIDDSKNSRVLLSTNQTGYVFSIARVDTNDSIEVWWQKNSSNTVPHTITKTQFKNIPAYFFKNDSSEVQVPMDLYMIKKDGYLLEISYQVPFNLNLYPTLSEKDKSSYLSSNDDFNKGNKILIDQILSTFKFTN